MSISSEMSLKGFMSIDFAKSRTIIGGFTIMTFFLPASAAAAASGCLETFGGTAEGARLVVGGTNGAGLLEIDGGTIGAGEDGRDIVGIGGTAGRDGCFGSFLTVTSG